VDVGTVFTFLNTGRYKFLKIYCHSPGGDTVAALSDTAFYTTYVQSPHGENATALAEFAFSECSSLHYVSPVQLTQFCSPVETIMSKYCV